MSGINELIRTEEDGSLSFGNYELAAKGKVSGFEHAGDLYKVKTYSDITKLEKNEMFDYESTPGTVVTGYDQKESGLTFCVEGCKDTQVIVAVDDDAEYQVAVDGTVMEAGSMRLAGKLVLSLELEPGIRKSVSILKK